MDKENATIDLGSPRAASRKKSRSKSIGPGGLDALKQTTGNRRASLAAPVKIPRSILKPPISALPEIPPLKKGAGMAGNGFGSGHELTRSLNASASEEDPTGSKVLVRTEEEQQAAAREREERERRDARRKSLANRRVSFAAEATLHTFHEVEYMQDSTTSTDSTRRASSAREKAAGPPAGADDRKDSAKPQAESTAGSPEKQGDSHQRRRRRSSGAPLANLSGADDDTGAWTAYSSDSEPADAVEEVVEDEDEASSSDSDDGTMMTIDTEEVTGTSVASDRSAATADDSTLDEALRIAARRAGTQNLEGGNDDAGDDDGEEVIPSFGWVKKGTQTADAATISQSPTKQPGQGQESGPDGELNTDMDMGMDEDEDVDMDMDMDMDMTHAIGRILKPPGNHETDLTRDVSMDVTHAFGGILSYNSAPIAPPTSDHQEQADPEEATMEFTTAIGGIRRAQSEDPDDVLDNEDMSMELTTVVGEVLSHSRGEQAATGRQDKPIHTDEVGVKDAAMDPTVGLDRFIAAADAESKADGDATLAMDMTTALGGILSRGGASARTLNKRIMEEEVNEPNSPAKAIVAAVSRSPSRKSPRRPQAAVRAPSESPGLSAFRGKELRRSVDGQTPSTPRPETRSRTASPVKTATPQRRPASTSKHERETKSPATRTASPRKHNPQRQETTPSREKATQSGGASIFRNDPQTGDRTPNVVLTPPKRQLSGIGADRPGLGSPKVAALCSRRCSIGESASDFALGRRTVAFEEPKKVEEEVDRMRQEEEDKENRVRILEREADGPQEDRDATFNLREMIDSLSPKWRPLRGRKSLHVGSAKGLLGKRPAELDEDDEGEDNDGVKRLKGHQSSPVKNVRLQQPESARETTGRLTRSARRSLEQANSTATPSVPSPLKNPTPQGQGRFKEVGDSQTVHAINLQASSVKSDAELAHEVEEDKIHLQDFLNMISIRFMELNTTRRRHTMAPASGQDGTTADGQDALSLERCVVAGACTVPMLELYQHSCRELKKYISEGRRMVKEIEKETHEENPPLFREYMSASPEVKALMDNQFKNVKSHARLLSKAMWYEWRMKLQVGLQEGLVSVAEGMDRDDKLLEEQQRVLASVLPAVVARYECLQEESTNLQEAARELADCDPAELESARQELTSLDADIASKKQQIAALRRQLEESSAEVQELGKEKAECLDAIKACEKTKEECRGWTGREVNALKARVEALENKHGWAVRGLSGSSLSLSYRREMELVIDVGSLGSDGPKRAVDVRYVADGGEHQPVARSAERDFFMQCIRRRGRTPPRSGAEVAGLLRVAGAGWDKARLVARQIRRLNTTFPTVVARAGDGGDGDGGSGTLVVTSSVLLVPLQTRIEVALTLGDGGGPSGVDVGIAVEARVVYGEPFNEGKMAEFLAARIGSSVGAGAGGEGEDWSEAVGELQRRLIAKGAK